MRDLSDSTDAKAYCFCVSSSNMCGMIDVVVIKVMSKYKALSVNINYMCGCVRIIYADLLSL
jgi:hypothetical protein